MWIDRHGYHSDKRHFDGFDVNKNNSERQTEAQAHPFREADFKRPFVLRLKLQGNTEVTFCHFFAFHMLSNCCQLSRWLPFTKKKATFQRHFISGWLCANILSIRSPLNYFLVDKETFCPLMLDWPSLCFSFVQLKVNFQSVFFPSLQCSYLSTKGWLSTQALFQRHLALHLPSHTHGSPGSLRGQPSHWAASVEQMGLRAKAVHWLLPFFYISTFSTQTLKLCLVMHRFRSTNGGSSVQAEHWSRTCISSSIHASPSVPHSSAASLPAEW